MKNLKLAGEVCLSSVTKNSRDSGEFVESKLQAVLLMDSHQLVSHFFQTGNQINSNWCTNMIDFDWIVYSNPF